MGRASDVLAKFESDDAAYKDKLIKAIYAKFPNDMKDKRGGKMTVLIDTQNLEKALHGKSGNIDLKTLSSQDLYSLASYMGALKK